MEIFCVLQIVCIDCGTNPASCSLGIGDPSPGIKLPGSDLHYVSAANTCVTNEWSCTSTRRICLHGVDRDSFIFLPVPVYTAIRFCSSRHVYAVPLCASCLGHRLSVPHRYADVVYTLSLLCPVDPHKLFSIS